MKYKQDINTKIDVPWSLLSEVWLVFLPLFINVYGISKLLIILNKRDHYKYTTRVFHVERSFPRRFNVEYTWYICRDIGG